MQTIRDIRHNQDGVVIPSGFTANGWSSVLSHEMNVLFQSLCFVVTEYETKAEMEKGLDEIEALKGTFSEPVKEAFKSEADYEGYVNLLNRFKSFLKRSDYDYPTSRAEAIQLFVKWGLVIDNEDAWDIPIHPFPDASQLFKLSEVESLALAHVKLEALVHPIFSRLVMMLHEREENTFSISKAEMKEMLNTNDQMLAEVLIKLTPYMEEAIENMLELPDDEKLNFTIVWERIYEDFLGQQFSSNVQ
ncbi:hypothetical protein BAG01nite_25170 [Brevibacillus agri]|uniref:Uncharacterized protein n=1 Tax=Brevibacillus agri TaxID=51101 RepID=A0A3M8AWI1_9BACL|nr:MULTISPECIES: DUF6042 family protein [Brevibacillus]ELK41422.1 hypothetical protein D478_13858 [Brevibacillus agri BAB-2500]EJL40333.1 hypothetical protein PMI08_04458 [Brevibacillus sp. CF112]MBG9567843.1 hypothetical protein [Brevibacillus agri]MBY0051241.1 hypothetical protein [Brevibacillus agri]MCG5250201.1 DUF6042 family protein [Brevibacillus agri]